MNGSSVRLQDAPAVVRGTAPTSRRSRWGVVGVHAAVSALLAAVWLPAGPASGPMASHVAELVGLEAVWLMSSSVLMLSRSQRIERAVGGVELELWWHRVCGATGLALGMVHPRLFVHVDGSERPSALAGLLNLLSLLAVLLVLWSLLTPQSWVGRRRGPLGWLARRSYDRWRAVHGALAVFVLIAMAHGALDSRALATTPLLAALYAAVCAMGLYALVDRLVLTRNRRLMTGASVVAARRYGTDVVVLRLLPDRPLTYEPGQFVELDVPASRERAHPFTIVSSPRDPMVEVAVQASGKGTARIVREAAVGDRVRLGTVRGLPGGALATDGELWLASGIGITPFVARLRAHADELDAPRVDLVWTRRGFADAPYVDELREAAREVPWFSLHLRDTGVESRLTVEELVGSVGPDLGRLTVRGCGNPAAIDPLVEGLVSHGVPRRAITTEAFTFR